MHYWILYRFRNLKGVAVYVETTAPQHPFEFIGQKRREHPENLYRLINWKPINHEEFELFWKNYST